MRSFRDEIYQRGKGQSATSIPPKNPHLFASAEDHMDVVHVVPMKSSRDIAGTLGDCCWRYEKTWLVVLSILKNINGDLMVV